MKTNLKILYKTPDLDKLAEKHQDFDALMDAVMDEKNRRRKKLYRIGSLATVAIVTAFLSWLYWGYEPGSATDTPNPQEQVQPVVTEEEKVTEKPADKVPEEEEPVLQTESQELERTITAPANTAQTAEKPEAEKTETTGADDSNDLAMPAVITSRKVSIAAEPVEGMEHLYEYLYRAVKLPDSLLSAENGLFMEVSFTVEPDGTINNIGISKDLPEAVEEGLKAVFRQMPAWKAAKLGEDAVASDVKLPVTFLKKNK